MSNTRTCLWLPADQAPEFVNFYVHLVDDSRVEAHRHFDNAENPEQSVDVWDLVIGGTPFQVMGCARPEGPTMALSLNLRPEDQATLDRYWDGIVARGGQPSQCGWITDPWGFSWQICPQLFYDLAAGDDDAKAQAAVEAVWGMVKIDLAQLKAAADAA